LWAFLLLKISKCISISPILDRDDSHLHAAKKSRYPYASYFGDLRKKYAQFEGSLKGIDARILIAQVPTGMLTNMESQLKEQGAEDKMD
jgi:pyruvate/oxaloacetate carboxyltransferase